VAASPEMFFAQIPLTEQRRILVWQLEVLTLLAPGVPPDACRSALMSLVLWLCGSLPIRMYRSRPVCLRPGCAWRSANASSVRITGRSRTRFCQPYSRWRRCGWMTLGLEPRDSPGCCPGCLRA
jgi:hypothetical protein